MNKIYAMTDFMSKVRKSNSKDFKQLSKEIELMLKNKIIDRYDYGFLLGYLSGVIDTKIDYNIEEK